MTDIDPATSTGPTSDPTALHPSTDPTGLADTGMQPAGEGGDGDAEKDWKTEAAKWKSLARKHETTARSNSTAAKKLADIEESQKTEQQRLLGKVSELETEIAAHRARDVQATAARAAGLDPDLAEFVTETDPDRALDQAKTLAKRLQPPRPDLKQGARPNPAPAEDVNAWLRRAAGYN